MEEKEFSLLRKKIIDRTESICRHLYPSGKIIAGRFVVGGVDGGKGQSMNISLAGDKKGLFNDFATNESGDVLTLWALKHGLSIKSDFSEVVAQVSSFLGVSNETQPSTIIKNKEEKTVEIKNNNLRLESENIETNENIVPAAKEFHNHVWKYLDKEGKLYCSVTRYNEPNGKKRFLPRKSDGSTGIPENRILYNLPFIEKSDTVIFVEGEKCADAINESGLCGTCVFGGANSDLDKVDFSPLEDKKIILWKDNDSAGEGFAKKLSEHLDRHILYRSLEELIIPKGKPNKWDAYDALVSGVDIKDFIDNCEIVGGKISFKTMGDVLDDDSLIPPQDLVSPRVITDSAFVVIGGQAKIGKSFFLQNMMINWCQGKPFLGMTPRKPLSIFYFQNEIELCYLKERMERMIPEGSDSTLFRENCLVSDRTRGFQLDDKGAMILGRALLKNYGRDEAPDIIVIDPIANVFYGKKDDDDENSNSAMIAFCRRAEEVRDKYAPKAAIVFAHHITKMPKKLIEEDPFNAFRGASALRGYYHAGILLTEGDGDRVRNIHFETRHGLVDPKRAMFEQNCEWRDLGPLQQEMIAGEKQKAIQGESDRKSNFILKTLFLQSKEKGRMFLLDPFCSVFSDKHGFGSSTTLKKTVEALIYKGDIRYKKDNAGRKFLVVKDMIFKGAKVNPTHKVDIETGSIVKTVENEKWEEI